MKPETRFWHWLGGVLPPGHFCRVEPPPSPGIPDVDYCISGVEGWIELKVGDNRTCPFKRPRKGLRTSQKRWIRKRLANRGRVFVFVAIGASVYCFTGSQALLLKKDSVLEEFKTRASLIFRRQTSEQITNSIRSLLVDTQI